MSALTLDPSAVREVFTAGGIKWQAASVYETKRGKKKPIVTGIPSSLFWRRYKHGLRSQMNELGLSVRKLAKGQWEVICWPRAHSLPILADLGFVLPSVEVEADDENPF